MADKIERTRDKIFKSLQHVQEFLKKAERLTSVETIEVRLQRLDELWGEFQSLEAQIISDHLTIELKSAEFEDQFFDVKAELMKIKNERFPVIRQQPPLDAGISPLLNEIFQQQRTFLGSLGDTTFSLAGRNELKDSVQLPKVKLDKFDGTYRNWPAFEDAYTSSIHSNQSLSNVTKFKLLKQLMEDGPGALIKNILETDANYEEAWSKLKSRYRKRKHILMSYITAFMDQPAALTGRPRDIRSLSDKSDELIIGIRTMGLEAEYRDAWLIQILLRKLDPETRQDWIKDSVKEDFPSITRFLNFLNLKCDGMDEGISEIKPQQSARLAKPSIRAMHLSTTTSSCLYCKRTGHLLHRCMKFRLLNGKTRRLVVSRLSVCENCLKPGHTASSCSNSFTCRHCNQLHHSLLHIFNPAAPNSSGPQDTSTNSIASETSAINSTSSSRPSNSQHSSNVQSLAPYSQNPKLRPVTTPLNRTDITSQALYSETDNSSKKCLTASHIGNPLSATEPASNSPRAVILPTALVHVRDNADNLTLAHALLDSGSQCTLVSEKFVQRLRLSRAHSSSIVSGLSNKRTATTRGVVSIEVSSRFDPLNRLSINAYIIPSVVTLASAETAVPESEIIKSLKLADPHAGSSREIDILLGADVFFDVIYPNKIVIDGRTHAQSTMFGWVIIAPPKQNTHTTQGFSTVINEDNVNQTLQKFWEIGHFKKSRKHPTANLNYETVTNAKHGSNRPFIVMTAEDIRLNYRLKRQKYLWDIPNQQLYAD